jgi:hypothetical protein
MPNLSDSYVNALLTDATYALNYKADNGLTGFRLSNKLNARMTLVLANYISKGHWPLYAPFTLEV